VPGSDDLCVRDALARAQHPEETAGGN